jgi:hypothetical protein
MKLVKNGGCWGGVGFELIHVQLNNNINVHLHDGLTMDVPQEAAKQKALMGSVFNDGRTTKEASNPIRFENAPGNYQHGVVAVARSSCGRT